MYLMDASAAVNNRKWNLGRLGMPAVRLRGLRGLGDAGTAIIPVDEYGYPLGIDPATGLPLDSNGNPVNPQTTPVSYVAAPGMQSSLNTPTTASGVQNPSPVAGGASNGGVSTVMATTPSKNPLDYTSPQAAIAAGLDPQTTYNAWTAALAKFPSSQAAISAGVPAGVVNQLWQQSNVNAANKAAASASSGFFGLSTNALLGIGGGVALLAILGGKKRR